MKRTTISTELAQQITAMKTSGKSVVQISYALDIPRSAVERALKGKIDPMIKCKWCGKEFIKATSRMAFCSDQCRNGFHNFHSNHGYTAEHKPKTCIIFGKLLTRYQIKYCAEHVSCYNPVKYQKEYEKHNKPKPKKKKNNIAQMCREAAAAGMSYGEYMAQKSLQNKPQAQK